MPIKFGSNDISNLYMGSAQAQKVYFGSQQVWPSGLSLWTPAQLTNLVAWWDFGDPATVTTDGSGNISQVLDKSGNGHHMTQATTASRPQYALNAFNGLNAALFNGAQSLRTGDKAFPFVDQMTGIAMLVLQSGNASFNKRALSYFAQGQFSDTGSLSSAAVIFQRSNISYIGAFRFSKLQANKIVNYDTLLSATSIFDGVDHNIYIDDVVGFPSPISGLFGSSGEFRISFDDSPWFGYINEVFVTSDALPEFERQKSLGYSHHRWGIQSSLPTSNPFKNSPPVGTGGSLRPWEIGDPLPSGAEYVAFDPRVGISLSGNEVVSWLSATSGSESWSTTPGQRPLLNTMNGVPVVRADTFDKTMTLPSVFNPADAGGTICILYDYSQYSSNTFSSVIGSTPGTYSNLSIVHTPIGGDYSGWSGGNRFQGLSTTVPGLNNPSMRVLRFDGTNALNRSLFSATLVESTRADNGSRNFGNHDLWRYGVITTYSTMKGRVGPIFFILGDGGTQEDFETIEGFAAHHWSQTGILPPSHPYKLAPPTTVSQIAVTSPGEAMLLMVAGQSNARAAGNSSATPPVKYTDGSLGQVFIFVKGTGGATVLDDIEAGTFEPYDVTTNADPDNSGTSWGPEAEFIYQLRQGGDNRPVYVVKEAASGQDLQADWNPATVGGRFDFLEAKVAKARALYDVPFRQENLIWNQGEADSDTASDPAAANYAANFTAWFTAFRNRISTDAFVIVNRIRPLGYGSGTVIDPAGRIRSWIVREAQVAVPIADGFATTVDTDFDPSNFWILNPPEPWTEGVGLRSYHAWKGDYDLLYATITDSVPSAYTFSDLIDVPPSTLVVSPSLDIAGIERQSPVTVTNGEFRTLSIYDNDATVTDWTTTGFVDKFQRIQLRTTSDPATSTAKNISVDIGGVADTWSVTTYATAPVFEAETSQFITQVAANGGGYVSGADAAALDAFYVAVKATTWWSKLLRLYLRLGDRVASSLDLVDGTTSLALVNVSGLPYTWSTALGWAPQEDADTGIDLKVNPSTQMPQNDSAYGAFYSRLASNTRDDVHGGPETFLRITNAGVARYSLNSNTGADATGLTTATGLRAVVRDGAASIRLHGPTGSVINSNTVASLAPTGDSLALGNPNLGNLGGGTHSDAAFFGAFAAGQALTTVEVQDLASRAETLMSQFT